LREKHQQPSICGRHYNISGKKKILRKKMLKKLKVESEKAGMRLNLKKTKIMTTGNLNKFKLDGTEIEIIDSYTLLGMIITRDGSMSKEINRRISSGRLAMVKLEKIMKDRDMTATTNSKIVTYGSESWALERRKGKKSMLLSYGHGEKCYECHRQKGERTPQ
jgi:hypothetical protein